MTWKYKRKDLLIWRHNGLVEVVKCTSFQEVHFQRPRWTYTVKLVETPYTTEYDVPEYELFLASSPQGIQARCEIEANKLLKLQAELENAENR